MAGQQDSTETSCNAWVCMAGWWQWDTSWLLLLHGDGGWFSPSCAPFLLEKVCGFFWRLLGLSGQWASWKLGDIVSWSWLLIFIHFLIVHSLVAARLKVTYSWRNILVVAGGFSMSPARIQVANFLAQPSDWVFVVSQTATGWTSLSSERFATRERLIAGRPVLSAQLVHALAGCHSNWWFLVCFCWLNPFLSIYCSRKVADLLLCYMLMLGSDLMLVDLFYAFVEDCYHCLVKVLVVSCTVELACWCMRCETPWNSSCISFMSFINCM